ncbi:MAG TPA: hypothetical protein VE817_10435, partial [Candidatus Acidoferrum sp.]|nr:hypothetical protein [Candidatus Acidoferrum sp.]
AALVDRCSNHARRMARHLVEVDGAAVLNDVVLNQVLVRFAPDGVDPRLPGDTADALTRDVIRRVQLDGTCWLGGTTWHGMAAMRVSVSGWNTTAEDIDRSADVIGRSAEDAREAFASEPASA